MSQRAGKLLQQSLDFVAGQDDRPARQACRSLYAVEPVQLMAEHLAIQEQNGGERLVLSGCGDMAVDRKVGKEGSDLASPNVAGWRLPVKEIYR